MFCFIMKLTRRLKQHITETFIKQHMTQKCGKQFSLETRVKFDAFSRRNRSFFSLKK